VFFQIGEQSTRHNEYPNNQNYGQGQMWEHALLIAAGGNFPFHVKDESGFELQVGLQWLYDLYYINDRSQGQTAYLDHHGHSFWNLQGVVQGSYVFPHFLAKDGFWSRFDFSLFAQAAFAYNSTWDYQKNKPQAAKQVQFAGGASIVFNLTDDNSSWLWRNWALVIQGNAGPTWSSPDLSPNNPATFDKQGLIIFQKSFK
jgi:hypothetical protein